MNAPKRLVVDIVADFVCPWCFVGVNSFLQAKPELSADFQLIPRFRAYQLNPDTPPEGFDRQAYYERKFPDKAFRSTMRSRLMEAGETAGATFDPATPTRLPNTIRAHQMLRWSHLEGLQERTALSLYRAYWEDGEDLGDIETLARIADAAGLDPGRTREKFEAREDEDAVRREAEAFRAGGVSGVPTFIVNERSGFSGALPPGELANALRTASAM